MTRPAQILALWLLGVLMWLAGSPALAHDDGARTQASESPTSRTHQWITSEVNAPRVSFHTFDSAAAKTRVSYHLYTPAAYDRDPEQRLPVVYWLHGSGGGLVGIPAVAKHFDAAIETGRTPPFLVVFVNGLEGGMYVDWKDGSAPLEQVIVTDLVTHIDATHRTIPTREGRMLDGFSMGGYGAARLGFKYPDVFRAVSIVGAGPLQAELVQAPRAGRQRAAEVLQRVYGGDQAYFREVSPRRIAEQNAPRLASGSLIRQVVGDADETCANNRAFHEHLEQLAIPHDWRVLAGVDHDPAKTLEALGDENWIFYRAAFADTVAAPCSDHASQKRFTEAADYSARHSGRALLIVCNGAIVFERYGNGWSAERAHPLASGSKSFTGVMAMLAVQDGLLSLDELAMDTLPEWTSDPRKSKITIRHLLTLSSGLPAGDRELSGGRSGSRILGQGAARRAERLGMDDTAMRPDNLNERALTLVAEADPGQRFQYGPSHFYAFSEVLQRKLAKSDLRQKTTMEYLRTCLLEPLGIHAARIGRDRAGNPNLPGGVSLSARDWSKFGQFVLDGGSVSQPDGAMKTLLKPELLEQCFVPSATNMNYGLTWWLRSADAEADVGARTPRARRQAAQNEVIMGPDGAPLKVMMAAGLGKQRLYIIPQFNMVIVRFAEATTEGQRFDDRELLGRILGVGTARSASKEQPLPK